jgi:hypothetical protein
MTSYLKEKVVAPVWKTENTAIGIRHADHVAPLYPQKLALTSPTSGGRSVGIVRLQIQATEFSLVFSLCWAQLIWTMLKLDMYCSVHLMTTHFLILSHSIWPLSRILHVLFLYEVKLHSSVLNGLKMVLLNSTDFWPKYQGTLFTLFLL